MMWRSVARASLSNSKHLSRRLISSEVISSQTLVFAPSPPQFYTGVFPKPYFFQNPRFFSIDSAHKTGDFDENAPQAPSESVLTLIHDDDSPPVSSIHDDNASQVSSESDSDLNEINENHDPQVSLEADSGFNVVHDEYNPQVSSEAVSGFNVSSEADFNEIRVLDQIENSGIDMEKLEKLLSLLQSSYDGSLDSLLDDMGLDSPDEEFTLRVLKTPLILGENLIGFYKWASSKDGFVVTARVVEALAGAVCGGRRAREAYALWDLIREIGEKETNLLSVEILNDLIAVLSLSGKGKMAFEIFNKVEEFGCTPNARTYYLTIEALCRRSLFDSASGVCEQMVNSGSLPEDEEVGKIMHWLCRAKKVKDAHLVYMLAKEQKRSIPQKTVCFLIRSLSEEDESVKFALELLDDLSENEIKYAMGTFSAVVNGLCRAKDIDGAKDLLVKMISEGPPPGRKLFNSIVTGYCKAGDFGKAVEVARMMGTRGLKPDSYTYTLIISGYAKTGQKEEAIKLISEARKEFSKLSPALYHTLIRVHCKLEQFDKALKFFDQMKKCGIQPSADMYRNLIRSLCLDALDWKAAQRLAKEMETRGFNRYGTALIRAVKDLEQEATTGA